VDAVDGVKTVDERTPNLNGVINMFESLVALLNSLLLSLLLLLFAFSDNLVIVIED